MPPAQVRHVNPWIVTAAVMGATFMEILDTTVVNVSVPHLAGSMGATVEEGTWVVTSLSGGQRHHPAHVRMAGQPPRPPQCPARLRHRLHHHLSPLRHGYQPRVPHLLPHPAGPYRRRLAAARPSRPARDLPAQAARNRHGGLRPRHYPRAHPRPHARRLDHRQLLLALDLLPQRADRCDLRPHDERFRPRPALYRQEQDRRHRPLGHRIPRPRFRHVTGGSRHRAAQRLVRQHPDPRLHLPLRLRTGCAGHPRADHEVPHRRPACPQGPHLRRRHQHHDHAGLCPLR